MKPRVAFLIDQWRAGSGTENQLLGLLQHLAPARVDAELITLRRPLAPDEAALFPCPVSCLGVGSLASPKSALRLPSIAAELRRRRFDAAMIYFVDSNLYLVPACRLAGIGSVVINRRDMGYWYEAGVLRRLNFVNRWASHFLVNSEAVRQQVIRHEHFPPERIVVIPNGLWGGRVAAAPSGSAPDGFPARGPVVGITASLRRVKRIDRFLDMAAAVAARMPEARFVIAGQGDLRPELEAQVRVLGLQEAVVFLGQVSDVPALLGRLDAAVLTSESEGLSNSLIEYGLAGVPAVAFDVGGNSEVIADGRTGFLAGPGNVADMADKVLRLLQDAARRREMGAAAARHCRETFAADRVADLTVDFLASLVPGAGRRREGGA